MTARKIQFRCQENIFNNKGSNALEQIALDAVEIIRSVWE